MVDAVVPTSRAKQTSDFCRASQSSAESLLAQVRYDRESRLSQRRDGRAIGLLRKGFDRRIADAQA
jgi:hypothetical protein